MAHLTKTRRAKLRHSQFAAPEGRGPDRSRDQYPIDTRGRAANAKARATQQYKRGRMSKAARDRIHAAANRILRRKKGGGRRVATRKQVAAARRNIKKAQAARRKGGAKRRTARKKR